MTNEQFTFHMEEFRQLKAEIAATVRLIYGTLTWATLASGGIWTWLLANAEQVHQRGPVASQAAWFIPAAVSIFACLGFYHFHNQAEFTGKYLHDLEAALKAEGLGWEHYLRQHSDQAVGATTALRFGFAWVLLIGTNLSLAFLVR